MPINYANYPADWRAISDYIRFERAGGKCEQCGAPHGGYIIRSVDDPGRYILFDLDLDDYRYPDGTPLHLVSPDIPDEYADNPKHVKVILTVAHLDHDTTNNDERNLRALCQRCHLCHDAKLHAENARKTRLEKKREAIRETGQLELW